MTTFHNLLYNRYWHIEILPDTGKPIVVSQSADGEKALHCTFECRYAYEDRTYGVIRIYNLSTDMIKKFQEQAVKVSIEAGYYNCDYGTPAIIWSGNVYHMIEYRENIVDRVLEIHTINTPKGIMYNNFVMAHITEGQTVNGMFEHLTRDFKSEVKSSSTLTYNGQMTTRPYTVHGDFYRECRILEKTCSPSAKLCCDSNGMMTIGDPVKIEAGPMADYISISPDTGLIGLPNQVPFGVQFRTLIDPRLKWTVPIPVCVQFKNSEIKGLVNYIGDTPLLPLDQLGRYKIISLTHQGDTRGTAWYTNVEAWSDMSVLLKQPAPAAR